MRRVASAALPLSLAMVSPLQLFLLISIPKARILATSGIRCPDAVTILMRSQSLWGMLPLRLGDITKSSDLLGEQTKPVPVRCCSMAVTAACSWFSI